MPNLAITLLTESFGLVANRLQVEIDSLNQERVAVITLVESLTKTLSCQPQELTQKLQDLLGALASKDRVIEDYRKESNELRSKLPVATGEPIID